MLVSALKLNELQGESQSQSKVNLILNDKFRMVIVHLQVCQEISTNSSCQIQKSNSTM